MASQELNNTVLKNSSSLKAYYRFESGVETTDSSGNSHTLSVVGSQTTATGVFGQAVTTSTNNAFSTTDHSDLKPTSNFSVSAWIKTTNASFQIFFNSFSQNSNPAGFRIGTTSGKAYIQTAKNTGTSDGTDYKTLTANTAINDGNWHHVVFTWNGATIYIYTDGKYDGSVAWANAPAYAATNYVRVGCDNNSGANGNWFAGSIDDLSLFNGIALTADQIHELYEGRVLGEGYPQSGLVAGYHLSNTTDFSGNNYHLTNNNTVTFTAGKFNNCANFGASNSNKNLVYTAGNIMGATTYANQTISCWVNITTAPSLNSDEDIVGIQSALGTGGAQTTLMYVDRSGVKKVRFYIALSTAVVDLQVTQTLSLNTWYHIVGVKSGTTTGILYLNGNQIGTASGTGTDLSYASSTYYLNIGSDRTATAYLSGLVDEVAIFNVAKDSRWVRQQYALGMGKYY